MTSYIPTTSAQVTRAADAISLATSAFPFSATAGTVVIEGRTPAGLGTQALWQIDDTTSAERFLIHRNTGGELHAVTVDGGVSQCDINLGVVANSTAFKVAFAWAAGDFAAALNGGTVGTDAVGTLPTVTTMRSGRDHSASEWNGHIKQITYLPRRASNAELQGMSS